MTTQAGIDGVYSIRATTTVNAGRNLILGNNAGSGYGHIRGQGVVLLAGGDIVLDNSTFVRADGGAGIQATAGGDFKLLHALATNSALYCPSNGPITVATGANRTFTLDPGG